MLFLVLLAVGVLAAACGPTGGTVNIYVTPYHKLIIRDVLPFSTARADATPAKPVRIKNVHPDQSLDVRAVRITGSSAFRLAAGQDTSFSLGPGQERSILVEYRPPLITNGAKGVRHIASLLVDTSDGAQPTDEVFLRGWQAADYENNKEPNRDEIVKTIGYTTTVGTSRPAGNLPAGEDIRSAYWRRANGSQPVELFPLARYATRTQGATGDTRWYVQGSSGDRRFLHNFAGGDLNGSGGENQKLVPTPSGTTGFNPGTSAFGITMYASGAQMFSDDSLNLNGTHNFRFWPAEDRDGSRLANTWIVGNDLGFDGDPLKNNDYQDFMWVLSNATPA
ncbi:hypothetical protein BH18ACT1_BH18ACT1_07360 [soil metagenome]